MERTRRPVKRHKASSSSDVASIDRLSNLPDAIICHILSFLPTKVSVSTSVLSKRWSSLWAHVPNLDFESAELTVLDIVNRVMLRYKVESINTFRISYAAGHHDDDDDRTKFQLETCIAAAILRNVKKLSVCFPVLPCGILTCKTLVDLSLRSCGVIPVTGTVYLPSLKRLHLDSVRFESKSNKSLEHLLSGCPVLEEMIVRSPDMAFYHMTCPVLEELIGPLPDRVCYHINSLTLQKLTIIEYCWVKIDTPSLRFLKYQDCLPGLVSKRTLDSLTQVEIVTTKLLREIVSSLDCYKIAQVVILVALFVNGLSNVKCLKFSSALLAGLDLVSCFERKFHNLTRLELDGDGDRHGNGNGNFLLYFLANADNLEVLIIGKVTICTMGPHRESKCLSSHLKTIRISRFGCTENEFELVRYLLWNAKVLRRMEVYSQHDGADLGAKFKALKRITLFPRGSVACELAFH